MSKPKQESNEENQNPNVFFDKENLIKRKKKQKKLLIIGLVIMILSFICLALTIIFLKK